MASAVQHRETRAAETHIVAVIPAGSHRHNDGIIAKFVQTRAQSRSFPPVTAAQFWLSLRYRAQPRPSGDKRKSRRLGKAARWQCLIPKSGNQFFGKDPGAGQEARTG
jgi:hypothetical protein